MQEGAKRRLVGTAVVVVLLVIFLPMLLEDEPSNPVPDADLAIPPRPVFDADTAAGRPETPEETFAIPAAPELPDPDSYPDSAAAEPERGPADELDRPDVAAVPDREAEPATSTPSSLAAPSEPPPALAEEEPDQPPPVQARTGPGWVLQVSSLTERARASTLERQLRAEGFPAFIEVAEVKGKTYHRVRVGPREKRSDIEALAASVKRKMGYEGQVLRYP